MENYKVLQENFGQGKHQSMPLSGKQAAIDLVFSV